ncbi:MAG: DUF4488 domain-containing protein [Bacteroidota bacterium]
MKFKHLVFFFLIIGASFHVSAQENPFIGKWELTGIPPDAGISFQKYFNSEGEFYNTRTVKSGIFKSHSGKYVVKDKSVYLEIVDKKTDDSRTHVAGQTTTILYLFSEDKKLLTIKGLAVNGNSDWTEVWKRIEEPLLSFNVRFSLNQPPAGRLEL